jgi:hypothetical protein
MLKKKIAVTLKALKLFFQEMSFHLYFNILHNHPHHISKLCNISGCKEGLLGLLPTLVLETIVGNILLN